MNPTQQRRRCPWTDFLGHVIYEGDTITHTTGESAAVEFWPQHADHPGDAWRARYQDGTVSRLCLQIGDKGQAVVRLPRIIAPVGGEENGGDMNNAIMPALAAGPMERAAKAARGHCEVSLDGVIMASPEWFYNYSRLLLKGACEARLRSLGTVGDAGEAVRDYLGDGPFTPQRLPQEMETPGKYRAS